MEMHTLEVVQPLRFTVVELMPGVTVKDKNIVFPTFRSLVKQLKAQQLVAALYEQQNIF